jgi:formate hydrogenlyase subunit 6/NADH:ubiquinone oxidoreductase subunit I
MKVGTMMGDVLRSLFRKPVTQPYPFERIEAPERFRGKLEWDLTNCTGCQLCIKDCPANAIQLLIVDKATKRFVMRYQADHCTYCGQCVVSCRFNCLKLSNTEWELAALTKEPFTLYYGRDEDMELFMKQFKDELDE